MISGQAGMDPAPSPTEVIMLESYFKTAHTIARLRSSPAEPFLDGFANALFKSGYAHSTIRGHLRTTAHLGAWMGIENITFDALDERVVRTFAAHLPACRCSWPSQGDPSYAVAGARLFFTHLRDQGVVFELLVHADGPLFQGHFKKVVRGERAFFP